MSELIKDAITEYYGERCPDHVAGCPCCDAWAEYDALIAMKDIIDEIIKRDKAQGWRSNGYRSDECIMVLKALEKLEGAKQ